MLIRKKEGEEQSLLVEIKGLVKKNRMFESLSKLKMAEEKYRKLSITHDLKLKVK